MATQPPASRQWFRLPSVGRPAQPVTPAPEPPAPQPRPPMFRAPFRPMGQPQPQESIQAPAAAGVSPVPTSPIRRTSVPSSPVPRRSPPPTTPSATTSPPKPRSPTPTTPPATASPPKPQVSAPSSSLPTSPTKPPSPSSMPTSPPKPAPTTSPPKPVAATFSVPTSPSKPALTIFSVRTASPAKRAPTTFPLPTSPPKPAPTTFSVPTSPHKPAPVGRRAPLSAETPPQSPYEKATAPPPSPLTLPPPQFTSKAETGPTIPAETEQKTVLVQTSSEKPKSWFNGTGNHFDEPQKPSSYAHRGNHEVHKEVATNGKVHRKQFSSDADEVGMRVITIAGENKGAFMEVIKSPLKYSSDGNHHTLHNKGSLKTQSDGTGWHSFSSSGSDEEKSKKDKNCKAKAATLSPPMGAFMNSNVQGVNNSIVFHSSCSHHDPGVHLSLSRKPSGKGFHVKDKSNGHHS